LPLRHLCLRHTWKSLQRRDAPVCMEPRRTRLPDPLNNTNFPSWSFHVDFFMDSMQRLQRASSFLYYNPTLIDEGYTVKQIHILSSNPLTWTMIAIWILFASR
jgi:hypothetical protein